MAKIFLIPGLGGDETIEKQRKHVERLNRFFNKDIYFFNPRWQTDESREDKLARLHEAYSEAGQPKKIVGISAGATLALILGAAHPTAELTTFAGKHKGSVSIGIDYQERAPAFLPLVEMSENILEQDSSVAHRLTCYRPFMTDGVVPMEDIIIPGARNKTLLLPFHTPAIIAGYVTILPFL